jgi:hypothetical protein
MAGRRGAQVAIARGRPKVRSNVQQQALHAQRF